MGSAAISGKPRDAFIALQAPPLAAYAPAEKVAVNGNDEDEDEDEDGDVGGVEKRSHDGLGQGSDAAAG